MSRALDTTLFKDSVASDGYLYDMPWGRGDDFGDGYGHSFGSFDGNGFGRVDDVGATADWGVPNKTEVFSYDAFDFNVGETFTNGRFREITLKPGAELGRAFQKGVNSPKSPFVTRGSTSQRVTNTEEARSVLALKGTSDVFPDTVTKFRVEESTRALIGPIKGGNGFQIVIDPNDLPKVVEIPRARKPLPSGR